MIFECEDSLSGRIDETTPDDSRWDARSSGGGRLALDVNYVDGRRHLPVIELRRAV
jgi:hypothetical protein